MPAVSPCSALTSNAASRAGGTVRVVNAPRQVRLLLAVTGLDEEVTMFDTLEHALIEPLTDESADRPIDQTPGRGARTGRSAARSPRSPAKPAP